MRACILKSTGQILEGQSNDGASMDALIENSIARGEDQRAVEFLVIPDDKFQAQIAAQNMVLQPPADPVITLSQLNAALSERGLDTVSATSLKGSA